MNRDRAFALARHGSEGELHIGVVLVVPFGGKGRLQVGCGGAGRNWQRNNSGGVIWRATIRRVRRGVDEGKEGRGKSACRSRGAI